MPPCIARAHLCPRVFCIERPRGTATATGSHPKPNLTGDADTQRMRCDRHSDSDTQVTAPALLLPSQVLELRQLCTKLNDTYFTVL